MKHLRFIGTVHLPQIHSIFPHLEQLHLQEKCEFTDQLAEFPDVKSLTLDSHPPSPEWFLSFRNLASLEISLGRQQVLQEFTALLLPNLK
jgi:hypothetical protein